MKRKIGFWGGSVALRLGELLKLGLDKGDYVNVKIEGNKIIIEKVER